MVCVRTHFPIPYCLADASAVTALAFIVVPFSLSTSAFGMNIQELNQSGRSLQVFLVSTAVVFGSLLVLWIAASTVFTAHSNFQRRTELLEADLDQIRRERQKIGRARYARERQKLGGARYGRERAGTSWYELLRTSARRHLNLGSISKGRFDPQAFKNVMLYGEPGYTYNGQWIQEAVYFLGLKRVPEDEDYTSVWQSRRDYSRAVPEVTQIQLQDAMADVVHDIL